MSQINKRDSSKPRRLSSDLLVSCLWATVTHGSCGQMVANTRYTLGPFFSLIACMSSEEEEKKEAKESSQFHFTAVLIIASSASSMIHWSVTV